MNNEQQTTDNGQNESAAPATEQRSQEPQKQTAGHSIAQAPFACTVTTNAGQIATRLLMTQGSDPVVVIAIAPRGTYPRSFQLDHVAAAQFAASIADQAEMIREEITARAWGQDAAPKFESLRNLAHELGFELVPRRTHVGARP